MCVFGFVRRGYLKDKFTNTQNFLSTQPRKKYARRNGNDAGNQREKGKKNNLNIIYGDTLHFFSVVFGEERKCSSSRRSCCYQETQQEKRKTFRPFMKSLAFTYSSTNNSSLTCPYIREKSLSGRF